LVSSVYIYKTATDIKSLVETIGLPDQKGAYAIHASAALYARGIRNEIRDYDIVVSPEVFQDLQKKYPNNCDMHGSDERISLDSNGKEIEIFMTWWGKMDPKKILSNAEKINGVWYASLQDVKEWKEKRGLEKDKIDVVSINKYLGKMEASHMLNKISSMLDAVADSLEYKGLIKEAYEIDKVADILDNADENNFPIEVTKMNEDTYTVSGPIQALVEIAQKAISLLDPKDNRAIDEQYLFGGSSNQYRPLGGIFAVFLEHRYKEGRPIPKLFIQNINAGGNDKYNELLKEIVDKLKK